MPEPMRLTRQQFLKLAGAAALVPPLGGAIAAEPVATRKIPKTGEHLPVIGLGTSRVFDVGTDPAVREERAEVLRRLFAGGAKVVDTAPSYGRAERVVGDLLSAAGSRASAFVATKVSSRGLDAGIAQMEGSFERLRVKRADLMQVHNLIDTATQLATLREWKSSGRIRYLGITHYLEYAHDDLVGWLEREELDFLQINYSVGDRNADKRLLPMAADKGVAVLINRPFLRGRLFRAVQGKTLPDWTGAFGCETWAQFFLKFSLSHPAVTCVIPGMDKPRYVDDNLGAGRGRVPDAAERRRMIDLIESL